MLPLHFSVTEKGPICQCNTTFSFGVGCLKLKGRNAWLWLPQHYAYCSSKLELLSMSEGLCLLVESNQQKKVFKNATSLETPCINMSPFFVLLKKPYLSISDGLCLLEESNRQQQACVLTQYKMIIVMKRIVKTIPTVTPTNINI